MADTYTQALKARRIEEDAYPDDWADRLNSDVVDIFDAGISGQVEVDIGSATTYALEAMQNGTLSDSHYFRLNFVGTPASAVTVTIPASVTPSKHYLVDNQTGQALTVKYAATAGVTIQDGDAVHVYCDGTSVIADTRRPRYDITDAEIAAGVTPVDYAYPFGNLRRYDGSVENAVAAALLCNGEVYVPVGTWDFSANLLLDERVSIRGESKWESILRKTGNFVGITIAENVSLSNFRLDRTGSDSSVGIQCTTLTVRPDIRSVFVRNQGSHGFLLDNCDLAYFSDNLATENGGDGMRIDATASAEGNANTIINFDARSNTGYGMNVVKGYSNFILGLQAQNNIAGGLRLDDARGNFIVAYLEASGTGGAEPEKNLILTANAVANHVFLTEHEGGMTDSSTNDSNTVYQTNRSGTYSSHTKALTSKKFKIPQESYDGSQYDGVLEITHDSDNVFELALIGASAQDMTLNLTAPTGGGARAKTVADIHQAATLIATGATIAVGAGQLGIGTTTATTVGAAGGASALPATPLGYLRANLGGTFIKVPYYVDA